MNHSKPRHNDWDPCHPGLLHEAAQDVAVSRRRLLKFVGAGIAIVVVGVAVTISTMMTHSDPFNDVPSNGIQSVGFSQFHSFTTCSMVSNQLTRYLDGSVTDEELKKRIFCHIKKCPDCRQKYNEMCSSETSGCGSRKATLKPFSEHLPTP